MKNGQGDFMKDIMMRDMKVMKIIFTRDTEISILMQKNVMANIGLGKEIGLLMKLIKSIAPIMGTLCLLACDPAPEAAHLRCGLHLSFDMPKGVDSIHVVIYKNDSIQYVFKDTIPCSKCSDNQVWVVKDDSDLKNVWGFGEYLIQEIAYCKEKKAVFSPILLDLKENFVASINVLYIDDHNDMYSPFIPILDNCGIDSTYQIHITNNDNCF